MSVLCLQSTLAAIIPCDLGFVGIPVLGWVREVVTWLRRVWNVGGPRAVVAGAILLAVPPSKKAPTTTYDAGGLPGEPAAYQADG